MASFVRLLTAYDKQNTMNSLTVVVLCAALAAANAGLFGGAYVAPVGGDAVIQGPSASASVHGPDGSVIAANQPGGAVVASARSGAVIAAHHAPVVAHGPVVAAAAPAVVAARYAAPAVVAHHGAPAVVAHHAAVVGAPVVARAGILAGYHGYPAFAAGSGLEGQYVHDFTENLYDNGQYHGEIYP
ncbi:hypothetical protein ILUMI_11804 [Ignelater luminosus]|uniref:Uncharacterized protein n=1 Tax=Ignelater luminosus TaxID=2038154 RepID=A0A8K0CVJ4_IGNLU|nr:hypothetical protein ILUMI_11804 [Ignelater luminosus]